MKPFQQFGIILGMSGLIVSCFSSAPGISSPDSAPPASSQILPIQATARLNRQVIQLEVAGTPEQQALGLMFRTSLADDRGMLFPFDPPRIVGFWMKNCKIALDMIFLREGIVRGIQVSAPPCIAEPCPTYGIDEPIDQVIEVRGGWTQEFDLQVGDQVQIEFLP
ncbi:MAG: DUF192 domain-containing protein [Oscillatoriales cyanobacterium RM2_1_1]|nr:DUF192 domain-containing protein [Oscillatoriales cyanobacterium RM2_1_1]